MVDGGMLFTRCASSELQFGALLHARGREPCCRGKSGRAQQRSIR